MERTLVRALIAQIERQMSIVVAGARFVETEALEIEGALGQPIVLGYAIDQ